MTDPAYSVEDALERLRSFPQLVPQPFDTTMYLQDVDAVQQEIEQLRILAHDYEREEGTHWCAVSAKYKAMAEWLADMAADLDDSWVNGYSTRRRKPRSKKHWLAAAEKAVEGGQNENRR
jgi:hypothetical protein